MPPPELAEAFTWYPVQKDDKSIFKLSIPQLSERSNNIYCIQVVIIRLAFGQSATDLPPQMQVPEGNFARAHRLVEPGLRMGFWMIEETTQYLQKQLWKVELFVDRLIYNRKDQNLNILRYPKSHTSITVHRSVTRNLYQLLECNSFMPL